ncbi:hypothetical protein Scel_52650 [Streptomyces cellostaticus]|nr:hypothetical protein Scel_52650 [Streptomyces cellostaticus]
MPNGIFVEPVFPGGRTSWPENAIGRNIAPVPGEERRTARGSARLRKRKALRPRKDDRMQSPRGTVGLPCPPGCRREGAGGGLKGAARLLAAVRHLSGPGFLARSVPGQCIETWAQATSYCETECELLEFWGCSPA